MHIPLFLFSKLLQFSEAIKTWGFANLGYRSSLEVGRILHCMFLLSEAGSVVVYVDVEVTGRSQGIE